MTLLPIALALSAALAPEPDAIVALPAAVAPSRWEFGTSVGGGWDSNPLTSTMPAGSEFGAARVWIARVLRASDADLAWLQLRYGGTRFAAVPDANLDRVEASAEWGHAFGEAFTLRLAGAGAVRVAGDPTQSGWDAGGRAMARLRVAAPFALRVGAGYVWRDARDPVYSGGTAWVDAGIDAALWRGAFTVVRYTLETGTDGLSGTARTGSGWRGGAGTTGGARPVSRIVQGVSADLRQDLRSGLFVQAGFGVSVVRTEGTSLLEHQAVAEIGWSR
jgi:hypothetical protein